MTDPNKADMKALLAEHGQTMQPDSELVYLEPPQGQHAVVILERVTKDLPDYCTHGYAQCVRCYEPCWIGHATSQVILSGEAVPLCIQCGSEVLPPDTPPTRHIEDHKRADGPHD